MSALVPSRRITAVVVAALVAATLGTVGARQTAAPTVAIDADDIGGVVTGAAGPEAGVWVIAETTDAADALDQERRHRRSGPLPHSRSAEGALRRLGPRLRARRLARRSKRRQARRSRLKAVAAPAREAAAEYYPAQVPGSRCCRCRPKSDFPGTGPSGNGIAPNIKSQGEWIRNIVNTDGCTGCHQMGGKATREIPESARQVSEAHRQAWDRRIQSGQAGGGMSARFTQVGRDRALAM